MKHTPAVLATALLAVLGGWILVGGFGGVAGAHAEFGQSAVTAGTTSTVTLYVPQEYGPNFFNVQVQVRIPNGWQAVGAAGNVLTFSNPSGLGEEFPITVIAPVSPSGPIAFSVRQTYNVTPQGGGDGGSFCNYPTNTVVCWDYTATLSALATSSPTTPPSGPVPNGGGSGGASGPSSGGAAQPPVVTSSESATAAPATSAVLESSGSSSTSVSSSAQMEVATTSSTSTDTGPSALPLITLAGVVALAAASGTVLLRRTNNTPD